MLKKTIACVLLAGGAILSAASPAAAQQTLNLTGGYFMPLGADARVGADCSPSDTTCDVDVLVANRDFLTFDIKDFNGGTVGAEWLVPIGEFVEAGAGISFSRRTVPSVYTLYIDRDGSEIEQELRLRIVPMAFTLRVLPLGQTSPVQPYFGAGLGIFNWRYSETGEFIDFNNNQQTFQASYVADGNATGPVVLGGLRFAGEGLSAGGEVRYQRAKGDLEPASDFAGSKIDLGGWTFQATVGVRFGR
jgi:hypothetical protein